MQFFELTDNPIIRAIGKRLTYNPDPIECPKLAFLREKTACIEWTPLVFPFSSLSLSLNTQSDVLVTSQDPALKASMSIGFVKDSIFSDAFAPITGALSDSGVYDKASIPSCYIWAVFNVTDELCWIWCLVDKGRLSSFQKIGQRKFEER